jgi:hypothetical protein
MKGLCELMGSLRLSEAQKKRLIVALKVGALAQGYPIDSPPRARVSEPFDTTGGGKYLSRA